MTLTEAAGQLGQDPRPAEGNILKKSWFSQRFTLSWLDQFAARKRETIKWCAAVDGAYTKNTNNSATGVLVFAVYEGKLYLRNYRKFFLEFPELIDQLPAFLISNGVDLRGTVYVEPKATGKSLVQTLRSKGGLNIVEDKPPEGTQQMQGKILRTSNAAPFLRGMGATLLDGIDWEEFIYDCTAFPNAKHSDLVDALTMAVDKVENEVDWVGLYGDVM
ncbi:MAG: phage terminase large subunit [Phaeodactylibacter sp.]|nr:phage terminase large subunit [Phaeodactylibacter sp.]